MHKINIIKVANKYCFKANSFDSTKHSFILGLNPFYSYAWEATRDARKVLKCARTVLAETDAQHTPVTGEDDSASMAEGLYEKTYKGILERMDGIDKADKEEREMLYNEIKMIVQGLLTIKENKDDKVSDQFVNEMIGKFSNITKENLMDLLRKDMEDGQIDPAEGDFQPLPPEEMMAGAETPIQANKITWFTKTSCGESIHKAPETIKDFTFDEIKEVIEEFAISACRGLQDQHPDITYILSPENNIIDLVSAQDKKRYVKLSIGENLLLSGIYPDADLPDATTHKFYQLYWKPIVDEVGGICLDNDVILKAGTPDLPRNLDQCIELSGFDINKKSPRVVKFKFLNNPENWNIDCGDVIERVAQSSVSKYTEEDYIADGEGGRIVKCINPDLESVYGRTGVVQQVIPSSSHVFLDVDFGHLIQRMDEKDIEMQNG